MHIYSHSRVARRSLQSFSVVGCIAITSLQPILVTFINSNTEIWQNPIFCYSGTISIHCNSRTKDELEKWNKVGVPVNPKAPSPSEADFTQNSNRARKYWSKNSQSPRLGKRKMWAASCLETLAVSTGMWKSHWLLDGAASRVMHPWGCGGSSQWKRLCAASAAEPCWGGPWQPELPGPGSGTLLAILPGRRYTTWK